ncbi:hypothetical protein PHLCEN_2v7770 [Hermanssonia centrifuga]|uniref:Uncharacterized protein n=1 Tax=Hermanssonia centrifuga TaxID=98765 RepID=A0A2R6NVG7_9APHY|nr:hypothetical protein PHLCEN_2v7770 [Hermanssonia centrifuga]
MPGRAPGSLKDKIANFEKKGAVPVPRGRFGTGAPPIGDTSSKKRGELYGNRVPGLAKPSASAVLSGRQRTVSTPDAPPFSFSRPTSPIPDVPPLALESLYDSDQVEPSVPRLPPSETSIGPRSVSDIQSQVTFENVDTLPEGTEYDAIGEQETETLVKTAPEVVAKSESEDNSDTTEHRLLTKANEADIATEERIDSDFSKVPLAENLSLVVSSPQTSSVATVTDALASKEDSTEVLRSTALDQSPQLPSNPDADRNISKEVLTLPTKPASPDTARSDITAAVLANSEATLPNTHCEPPVAAIQRTLSVGSDVSSTEETSTSSDYLPTPSDMSFQAAGSLKDEVPTDVAEDMPTYSEPQETQIVMPVVVPIPTPVAREQSIVNARGEGFDESGNILDPKEVIIISDPPKVISPAVTRAILVPAPSSVPSVEPISPSEHHMLERQVTRKSFHAVVHHKVRETSPADPVPIVPPSHSMASNAPRTPAIQRLRSQPIPAPQSPGFGDLADLVFDAALLEEHLSGASPSSKPLPPPTFHLEPAIAEERDPEPIVQSRAYRSVSQPERPTQASSSSETTISAAPSHVRTSTSQDPPSPSQRGSRYFSLRVRKQSMPGAYPRNSVCSEMSSSGDSSVLVSRPSTPPNLANDSLASDASSVRSSTKSWKSPRKSLGRASSWLFRGKNKIVAGQ